MKSMKSSQVKSSQVKSSQVKSSQVKSSQVKSSQVKSSQKFKKLENFLKVSHRSGKSGRKMNILITVDVLNNLDVDVNFSVDMKIDSTPAAKHDSEATLATFKVDRFDFRRFCLSVSQYLSLY